MNRRKFIRQITCTAALAALASLGFYQCAGDRKAMKNTAARRRAEGLGLREIAARKLHHDAGTGFVNPFTDFTHGDLGPLLNWKLLKPNNFKQYYGEEPVVPVQVDWPSVKIHDDLSVTFLKHAGLLIRDRGRILLVDPIFGSISRLIKDFSPLAFDPKEIPIPDHVLLTHGHYDHMDVPTLKRFPMNTHVVSPVGYDDVLNDAGLANRSDLDWFESYKMDGLEVTLVPCNHWTMRNPLVGPNRALWGSYVIRTASGPTIFIAGDAGWFDGYQELGREFKIDLAIFNLGAYEPRWFMQSSHMNPAEVVKAFVNLGADKLMIVHWGTFRLGDEPVHFPPRNLRAEMEKAGLTDRLVHLDHGRTLFYRKGIIDAIG